MSRCFLGCGYQFVLRTSPKFPLLHILLNQIRQMHHKALRWQSKYIQKSQWHKFNPERSLRTRLERATHYEQQGFANKSKAMGGGGGLSDLHRTLSTEAGEDSILNKKNCITITTGGTFNALDRRNCVLSRKHCAKKDPRSGDMLYGWVGHGNALLILARWLTEQSILRTSEGGEIKEALLGSCYKNPESR